ncbi:MAG: aspartate aminotransferase family protein [Chloroflexia bacterium]
MGRSSGIAMVRGQGAFLWDASGKRYLDFVSGHSGAITGHAHPRVIEAVKEQAGRLLHLPAEIGDQAATESLAAALREYLPREISGTVLASSGSEAVEMALWLARAATHRCNVIVFQRGFHGDSIGTAPLSTGYRADRSRAHLLTSGVFVAPYAYCYRCPKGASREGRAGCPNSCGWPLEQVRLLLKSQSAPEETAAVLIEPVLAEAGYVVPPRAFLQGLQEICREHSITLIFDEVHSGFGRSGRPFALERLGVVPDILVFGEGLASGLPLGGIAARPALLEKSPPWKCAPNPLALAAARATLDILRDEKLSENAAIIGESLLERLRSLQRCYPAMGEVRGLGLMVAVEFAVPGGRTPDKDRTRDVRRACLEAGLLLGVCGIDENILRWAPPLVIGEPELEAALTVFEHSLAGVISS